MAPAENANTPPPKELSITFPGAVTASGASATVYTADHQVAAQGPLTPSPADPATLTLPLPALADGVYTVVWSAQGAAQPTGVYGFGVDAKAAPAKTVEAPKATFKAKPTKDVIVAWVPWLALFSFTGLLLLRLFVTAPAARRMPFEADGETVLAASDRRLTRLAAVALAVYVPATVVQLAYQAGASKSFAFGKVGTVLSDKGAGNLWKARLLFIALAAIAVWAAALVKNPLFRSRAMLFGGAMGLAVMIAIVSPSGKPANWPRTIVGDALTFFHLAGAAVWIGGLVGLVALAVRRGVPADDRSAFWTDALPRFSATAMTCVGLVVVSGLWLYWTHVASLGQLTSTLYGKSLLIKLVLVAGLLALGGFNHLWLKPQIRAYGSTGGSDRVAGLIDRHLRSVVMVEVVLGAAVLFMVPYLSGSARNQALQTKAADISRSATAAGVPVTLTPSGLQPGLTTYTVAAPAAAKEVALSFASKELEVPARTVAAKAQGDGTFVASGFYTPMVGTWEVGVTVDGKPEAASLTLPITAKATPLPRAPAPQITLVTWLYGLLDVAIVVLVLGGAAGLSRRLAGIHRARAISHRELVRA